MTAQAAGAVTSAVSACSPPPRSGWLVRLLPPLAQGGPSGSQLPLLGALLSSEGSVWLCLSLLFVSGFPVGGPSLCLTPSEGLSLALPSCWLLTVCLTPFAVPF